MNVAVIGLSHQEAPIEIREMASFSEAKKIEATSMLLDLGIEEVIILSTCNRSEIYIASSTLDEDIKLVKDFYSRYFKSDKISDYIFIKKKDEAINYLYRVCSGLDSIVIGEDQILGQVKDALMTAMELDASKKFMNKLFREAITTAKNIKSTYKISENPLSISYIGVKFLKEKIGDLSDKKAFIIGVGKMGKLALNHLLDEGVTKIYCCNRNPQKIKELKEVYPSIIQVEYENRYDYIPQMDILVSATASTHTVVKKLDLPPITKKLYALDLALPRDIDPDIALDSNIVLFDIDSLKKTSEENEKLRNELSEKAQGLIIESITEFHKWKKTIKVDNTIKSLNERCEEIHRDTISYIYRKMDLPCREKRIVEKMLDSALKRLIREPIIALKQIDEDKKQSEYMKVIEELFDLG